MAYYFELYDNKEIFNSCVESDKIMEITIKVNDENFYFAIYEHYCDEGSYLVKGNEPDIKRPVYNTWQGWVCITNALISISKDINKSKIRKAGFFTLEECKKYIKEDFPKIYKEEKFKW